MNAFDKYLLSLPTPSDETETLRYKSENQPYIIDDDIVKKMHLPCGKKVKTRILKIYIPSQDVIITRNFPHFSPENPISECTGGFKEKWGIGLDENQEKRLSDMFYSNLNVFFKKTDKMAPQQRLEGIARIYKTISVLQERVNKVRVVLDTFINSM